MFLRHQPYWVYPSSIYPRDCSLTLWNQPFMRHPPRSMASTLYEASTSFYGINPISKASTFRFHPFSINPFVSKASTSPYHPWGINPRVRSSFVLRYTSSSTLSMLVSTMLGASTLLILIHPLYTTLCLCPCFVTCKSSNFMLSYHSIPFMHYILIHPLSIHYINLTYLSFNYYCNQTQHINYFQLFSYSLFFLSIPTCLLYLITHFIFFLIILWNIANKFKHNIIIQK